MSPLHSRFFCKYPSCVFAQNDYHSSTYLHNLTPQICGELASRIILTDMKSQCNCCTLHIFKVTYYPVYANEALKLGIHIL